MTARQFLLVIYLSTVGCVVSVRADEPKALGPDTLRVRILHTTHSITLGCTGDYEVVPLSGGKPIACHGSQSARISIGRSLVIGHKSFKNNVLISPTQPGSFLTVNGRRYRGVFILQALTHGKMDVINQLAIEEYLYGVLPKEVGTDWPPEALEAQAVVSRTYALANKATNPEQRYDVSNDVYSQVYGGLESEAPTALKAVDATKGDVLTGDDGKPIEAFFHSSCGGCTETPDQVWAKHPAEDVFAGIKDPYCKEDHYYNWTVSYSASTVKARLKKAGIQVTDIKKIKVAKKSSSGRAALFSLDTSRGTVQIAGSRFRMAMGPESLRSTLISDISRSGTTFRFEGHGWGHGVGLCQWGARGRAIAGQTHEQILSAYYPHAKLVRLWTAAS